MKFRLPLNLQLFSEEGTASGVEEVSAAETQTDTSPQSTGVEEAAAAEPNNFEKAFAKRLSAERAKWEQEVTQKYQGYEDYKYVADYLQEANGADLMTLKERIEMERLQARAERDGIPPEVAKRLDELEAKAAKAEEFEKMQEQTKQAQEFETSLKQFCEGKMLGDKPVNHMELWTYMHENGIGKPEAAYKAMKADILEQQLEHAEKEGVKKFLAAKGSIPTVTGNTSQGQVSSPAPKTFADARARAMQRFSQT